MIVELPAGRTKIIRREERPLNLSRKLQIVFQRALLLRGQVVQAQAHQRIGEQPVFFNGLVARFTKPIGANIHAFEG